MEPAAIPVIIPLINPNEPEARLVSLAIEEGQFVDQDETLCTLETTKSTADVIAEVEGFVVSLKFSEGDTVPAGAHLCYLSNTQDWRPAEAQIEGIVDVLSDEEQLEIPSGLRVSQPALKLAKLNNLDLSKLPIGPLVTETMVRDLIEQPSRIDIQESGFDPSLIFVYGGGGHGKSVIDLIRSLGVYRIHGIVDDGLSRGESVMGVPVLGGSEVLAELHDQGIRQAVNAVGGIGDITRRIRVFRRLAQHGIVCPTVIHPSSVVESSAIVSPGVQVFPHAYVGSEAQVGFGVIVNTAAVVSHDCYLDEIANISPGALLAGGVKIGKGSLIGMGVTINLGVTIGDNTRIGNSATVKVDVPENGIVRAGTTWPD